MDRALRTVATGTAVVATFYLCFVPGSVARRLQVALGAASLGMAVFLAGMALCNVPLQAHQLEVATALGLLVVVLTVELPSRFVVWAQGVSLEVARGVTVFGMVTASFVAAWAAGMPEIPRGVPGPGPRQEVGVAPAAPAPPTTSRTDGPDHQGGPEGAPSEAEVGHGRP